MALLAEYGFTEGVGTVAADTSGNGWTATIAAGAWASGHTGSGVLATQNGIDPGLTGGVGAGVVTPQPVTNGLSALTVMAWVKTDYSRPLYLLNRNADLGSHRIGIMYNEYFFDLRRDGSGGGSSTGTGPNTTGWQHVAFVWGAGVGTIYRDGVQVWTQSMPGTQLVTGGTAPFVIAWSDGTGAYVDDLRLFDTALTGAQVVTWRDTPVGAGGGSSYSGTATLIGSGSLAASPLAAITRIAALTGSGTLATAAIPALTRAASLSGVGTLATAATPSARGVASLTGSGSLNATRTPRLAIAAALSGVGSLTASTKPSIGRAANLTGSGTLATSAGSSYSRTATLTGSGTLAAATTPRPTTSVALSGAGTLTATSTLTASRVASLSGTGALSATAGTAYAGTATLGGVGTLAATARPALPAVAGLGGVGVLAASGAPLLVLLVALSGVGSLSATAVAPAVAGLSGVGALGTHGGWFPAPSARTIRIPWENRTIRILWEDRTLRVRP